MTETKTKEVMNNNKGRKSVMIERRYHKKVTRIHKKVTRIDKHLQDTHKMSKKSAEYKRLVKSVRANTLGKLFLYIM